MVLARFLPRNERFFDYFHDAVSNALEVAELMVDIFENYDDVEPKVRRMRDLERRGDEITHQIFNALNRSFVTPFDREDISALASRIDDFVDYVEETARRMWLYRMDRPTEPARMLARIICEQARAIVEAIGFLSDMKQSDKLPPPNAIKLSAIVAKVEARADFRYVDRIEWDTGGYYDIIYFTTDKAKVEIKINPVSGEPQ